MNIKNKVRKRAPLKRKQEKSSIRNIRQTGSSKFEFRKNSNVVLYKIKYILY